MFPPIDEHLVEDSCLVKPLPVAALLDRAAADDAVVEALAAKGNPELRRLEDAARREEGIAEEIAKALQG